MGVYSTLLEELLENPTPFIIERSVTKLWFYMYGFRQGRDVYERIEDPLYDGFSTWLARRFRTIPSDMKSSHSWANILLFMAFGSEYEAFNLAKEMWYEYKAEMQKKNNDEN